MAKYAKKIGKVNAGGSGDFASLTGSPYDNTPLAEALDSKQDKSNGVLTGCTITLGSYGGSGVDNDIRVTEGTWRISPSEYSNVGSGNTDFLDIVLSASGLQRYVELVGTTSNTIIKVEGVESAIAVRPTLLGTQVSLGSILVKDALIDPPVPDLSGYVPLAGTEEISGDLYFNNSGRYIGRKDKSSIRFNDTQIYVNVEDTDNQAYVSPSVGGGNANVSLYARDISDSTRNRSITLQTGADININGGIAKYDSDRTTEIDADGDALITRDYADDKYALIGALALKQDTLTETNFGDFINARTAKNTLVDADEVLSDDSADSNKAKKTTWLNVWTNYILPKIQAATPTLSNIWTFSAGLTISGGRLLFTNTSTASGDGWYRQAANILRGSINGTDRFELNTSGARTKGTHTFESTMFSNIVPTEQKIATINTDSSIADAYTPTTLYQNISRQLLTQVSTTSELSVVRVDLGNTLMTVAQQGVGTSRLIYIPFKLATTGTVQFRIRYGESATALASRTLLADTGTFSPALGTAKGGVIKGMVTIATSSGTAVIVGSLEIHIDGKNPTITIPLRVSSGLSTLVDNLLEVTCQFGTSSASDRFDSEHQIITKGS